MLQIKTEQNTRVSQGDIFRDIDFIEYAEEENGVVSISKIVFPLVVVLTQDCDLEHDYATRVTPSDSHDKWLLSLLVAPLYNLEQFYQGDHLGDLGYKMQQIKRTSTRAALIRSNQLPRYHCAEFPDNAGIVPSVIDFKHYFAVNVKYMQSIRQTNYVCMIRPLYREELSRRFAAFLSRIGLPE